MPLGGYVNVAGATAVHVYNLLYNATTAQADEETQKWFVETMHDFEAKHC